jgi:hypothetical protein
MSYEVSSTSSVPSKALAVLVTKDGTLLRVNVTVPPPPTFTLAAYPHSNRVFELTADRRERWTGEQVEYVERKPSKRR